MSEVRSSIDRTSILNEYIPININSIPLLWNIHFQLNWNIYPTCVLPENLYGKPISDLNISTLSPCIEYIDDHYHMNGISENILRNTIEGMCNNQQQFNCKLCDILKISKGNLILIFDKCFCVSLNIPIYHTLIYIFSANMNVFAVICSIAFITVTIIILIIALSMRHHSAKYYTNEDKRSGEYSTIFICHIYRQWWE